MAASQSNFATFSLNELRRKGNLGRGEADSCRILDRTDRTLHRGRLLGEGDPWWLPRATEVPNGWRECRLGPLFVLIRPDVICADHLIWHTNSAHRLLHTRPCISLSCALTHTTAPRPPSIRAHTPETERKSGSWQMSDTNMHLLSPFYFRKIIIFNLIPCIDNI